LETKANIMDTARWVAVYRALETVRPDALFRDPFAEKLAGERGREIAKVMTPDLARSSWPGIMRTKLIDDLVEKSMAEGCDRVINLAAGLDARPYRLALPSTLTWYEADLPAMVEEKERALARETPRCNLIREQVDLTDERARSAFLDRASDGASRTLIISEGLLPYLEDHQAQSLARDCAARPSARWWVVDLLSPGTLKLMRRRGRGTLDATAELKFAPENGVEYFEPFGWKPSDVSSLLREAVRTKRVSLFMRLCALAPEPPANRPGLRPWSAVIRYARA